MSAASRKGEKRQAQVIYAAIAGHWWSSRDAACACGWTKPPHSVGHGHHLADLAAAAIQAEDEALNL